MLLKCSYCKALDGLSNSAKMFCCFVGTETLSGNDLGLKDCDYSFILHSVIYVQLHFNMPSTLANV